MGYGDFSEWFIGHSGSTYYRKSDKEKYELFQKIEQYLTYLDYTSLERKGADLSTRIDQLEQENRDLQKKVEFSVETRKEMLKKMDALAKKVGAL